MSLFLPRPFFNLTLFSNPPHPRKKMFKEMVWERVAQKSLRVVSIVGFKKI